MSQSVPATEILKICVVGLGHWGPNLVRAFESFHNVKISCAVEMNKERRDYVSNRLSNIQIFSSLDDALIQSEFQAVVIATPSSTHYELGVKALQASKHVLIEKPLADSSDKASALTRLASQKALILMTGHTFIYNSAIIEARRLIDQNELGRVFYIRSNRTNLGPIRSDVNVLWDLASHDISIFNYLYNSTPDKVNCSGFQLLGSNQIDIAQACLSYPDGKVGVLFVSWLDPQKRRDLVMVGESKMLTFDDMQPNRPLKIYDKSAIKDQSIEYSDTFQNFRFSIKEGLSTELNISTGEPLKAECQHFVECIRNHKTPRTGGAVGTSVVKILEAMEKSMKSNGSFISLT